MRIVMITGSPHKNGTTSVLADSFAKGAAEAGHEVFRFDAGLKNVHPCIACEKCHTTDTGCAFKDDMEELNPHLAAADLITFVSPIYYYDITAQMKAVIDRFYAINDSLQVNKKLVLLTAMADDKLTSADGANLTFTRMAEYLGWEFVGIINADSCGTAEDIEKTNYPQKAYELGKSL